MAPHLSTNFEILKYYQSKSIFSGVYSNNSIPKLKCKVYTINFDEYELIGTHWIALYVNATNIVYFDSFRVDHIPRKIK